jgi:hypothetical protein
MVDVVPVVIVPPVVEPGPVLWPLPPAPEPLPVRPGPPWVSLQPVPAMSWKAPRAAAATRRRRVEVTVE